MCIAPDLNSDMRLARLSVDSFAENLLYLRQQLRRMIVERGRIASQRANVRLLLDCTSFCMTNGVEAVCLWFLEGNDRMGGCNSHFLVGRSDSVLPWGLRFYAGIPGRPAAPFSMSNMIP